METQIIPLSHNKFAVIDSCDEGIVSPYQWRAFRIHRNWYATTTINGRTTYMHRMIMGSPSQRVDHRDGDGLNNRRSNLRLCTHAQNMANQRLSVLNSSGYRGVSFYKRDGVWVASIKIGGKRRYIGRFTEPTEAAVAYDKEARKAFGEFARLNFPHEGEQGTR